MLDATAVLAVINDEPGASEALEYFDGALIPSVNLAETLQKAAQIGIPPSIALTALGELDVDTVPFDDSMAAATAALWPLTRHQVCPSPTERASHGRRL